MRALLDTCIIIDAMQSREPFSKDAQELFLAAANHLFVGCITAKASTDIYYLMHRHTHSDKASREVLSKLFSLFEVSDTAGIDCRRAIPSPVADFEDAVMIETASRTEVDCIVTRNKNLYAYKAHNGSSFRRLGYSAFALKHCGEYLSPRRNPIMRPLTC